MNFIITHLKALILYLCIFYFIILSFAAITGCGDSNGSSTKYDTITPTFDFEQIEVDYNGSEAITETCITTSMIDEAIDVGLEDADKIRVIDSFISNLEVRYDAVWQDVGSLQTITCQSYVQGNWDGPIDTAVLKLGDSGWNPANTVTGPTRQAFSNYLTNIWKDFELCVTCSSDNLFNNFALDYWISMDLTLTVAYDNQETVPAE